MSKTIISLKDVTFQYKNSSNPALNNITLDIKEGEFIVVTGLNGSGKSTLLYTLNGLVPNMIKGQFSGRVFSFDTDTSVVSVRSFADKIGLVFQDFSSQVFSTSIEAELAFGAENLGLARGQIKERIEDALRFTGLTDLRDREPDTLSGGQLQRLAIASLLCARPKVLCFDEPMTDLDPAARAQFLKILRLLRDNGHTIIIVEHQLDYLLDADRIIVMHNGRVVKDSSVKDVVMDKSLHDKDLIQPPRLVSLLLRIGIDKFVRDPDEALSALVENGFYLNPEKSACLRDRQVSQSKRYGSLKIKAEKLSFKYDNSISALDGADFNAYQQEFIAIVGANGSGKTTLAKHLNGLLKPQKGDVFLDGLNIRQLNAKEINKKIGFIFQNPDNQIFNDTVYDEVSFGLKLSNMTLAQIRESTKEALKATGLFSIKDQDPFCLTKGRRQLVALASALVTKPDVLILDEPTTGLDWKELKSVMDILKGLNAVGHTIIFITHSMELACEYSHRTIIMKKGSYCLNGLTRSVFAKENLIEDSGLDVPPIVRLSNKLSAVALNEEEFLFCLEKKDKI